jgi:23S rRNA (cytidine1920-2'-O)/16S rRNA (cytidine1409-2'-O)-methyltransferase
MRLDQYLTQNCNIQSRNKASELIKAKKVKVNGDIITKPSFKVEENYAIEILENEFFVSRAAYKLKYFLEQFNDITIENKNIVDIGSSTGGFTQVLLLNNAKSITCIDVGSNQLHETIKDDKRLRVFENTDVRDFKPNEKFEVVTCDVSFISILNIIDSIDYLAKEDIITLFKPQFEVGAEVKRDRAGVVKDETAIVNAREKFIDKTKELGWELIHSSKSELKGKEGNSEELFYFRKK